MTSITGTHFLCSFACLGRRSGATAPKHGARASPGVVYRAAMAITTTCLLAAATVVAAAAGNVEQSGGFAIYLGVLPVEMLRGYPSEQPERQMHKGLPSGRDQWHVVIAVFDVRTGARIEDAVVSAKVGEPGLVPVEKRLEPMAIAGAMSYGNYFPMVPPGSYRIDVQVEQPATGRKAKVTFTYPVPR